MSTFVMLTRVAPMALENPQALEALEQRAAEHIRKECPDVKWLGNYAILGPYDYLDIFTAPDIKTAAKVSTIVRGYGRAHSEIWAATEWREFKDMLQHMERPA